MSYILDALKKSEGERVPEGELPDWKTSHKGNYTPTPQGATRQQIVSIAVLSAILVVLLIGAGVWVFYAKPRQQTADDSQSEVSPAAESVKPAKRLSSAEFASQTGAETTPVPDSGNKATKTTFEKFSQVQQDAESMANAAAKSELAKDSSTHSKTSKKAGKGSVVFAEEPLNQSKAKGKKKATSKPKVVALSELPPNIRRALPPIGFSGHVYSSEDPKQSSVMINGRKMKEGTSVTHDLVLEKITESGAQFSFRGHHFYLGALVDWQYTEQ